MYHAQTYEMESVEALLQMYFKEMVCDTCTLGYDLILVNVLATNNNLYQNVQAIQVVLCCVAMAVLFLKIMNKPLSISHKWNFLLHWSNYTLIISNKLSDIHWVADLTFTFMKTENSSRKAAFWMTLMKGISEHSALVMCTAMSFWSCILLSSCFLF